MKPVLIQTLIRNNKKKTKAQPLSNDLHIDTATPIAKFIFWALAATIFLSILIA